MKRHIALFAIIPALAFGASGAQAEVATSADKSSSGQQQVSQAAGEILLPDGWAMTDAVSAGEVAAIMEQTDFRVFPEAASSSQKGRPIGSYILNGVPYSKVRFEANVSGGQQAFDTAASYLTETKEIDGAKWNSAVIGTVKAGEKNQMRILVLKNDLFLVISWVPEVYPDLDPEETSVSLAELLITNLYGE